MASSNYVLQKHFAWWHPRFHITVIKEGQLPHCPQCGMHAKVMQAHLDLVSCGQLANRDQWVSDHDAMIVVQNTPFYIHGVAIQTTDEFTYLGQPITLMDDDGVILMQILNNAWTHWACIRCILAC